MIEITNKGGLLKITKAIDVKKLLPLLYIN